jgi:hypothetical protein
MGGMKRFIFRSYLRYWMFQNKIIALTNYINIGSFISIRQYVILGKKYWSKRDEPII